MPKQIKDGCQDATIGASSPRTESHEPIASLVCSSFDALDAFTPSQLRFLEIQTREIEAGRGEIIGQLYVNKTAHLVIAETKLDELARNLFSDLNVLESAVDAHQLAEAFSRQTYLNYPKSKQLSSNLVQKVVELAGHRSVTKGTVIVQLFAGVSLEAAISMVALGGGIARLTSSKTQAMDATLYKLNSNENNYSQQIAAIEAFLKLRRQIDDRYKPLTLTENGREFFNMYNLLSKCISFFHVMDAKQLNTILKKIAQNEQKSNEISKLAELSANSLSARSYSPIIYPWDTYINMASQNTIPSNLAIKSKNDLLQAVWAGGGKIDSGLFVLEPGCRIVIPNEGLLEALKDQDADYLSKIPVKFELSGLSYETLLELVSHSEATISVLPNGNSSFFTDPVYRVQGTDAEIEWQKNAIRAFIDLKQKSLKAYGATLDNFNLCTTAVSITYTMALSDFHKLFIGRLSNQGNEQEIQELCQKMCRLLHRHFPNIIDKVENYYDMNNSVKY